ncbi:hypothetical protein ES332_D07G109400v1 [Gossypium tomentosum]|uniref:Uncharacterized protein n=1 Tax=Gossypium tomentosum TaxID=34277 RepID=A0A5D2K5V7_GOSTO|nr:hypothetical protein ES332_D07G109400v1 [Gossypium tomentosum]
MESILLGIEHCIFKEAHLQLTMKYIAEEIWVALEGMSPTKVPSDDGFPTIFFQKCWNIVCTEVTSFCLEILNEGRDLELLNVTNVVLTGDGTAKRTRLMKERFEMVIWELRGLISLILVTILSGFWTRQVKENIEKGKVGDRSLMADWGFLGIYFVILMCFQIFLFGLLTFGLPCWILGWWSLARLGFFFCLVLLCFNNSIPV